jgi:hypothetical protein
MVVACLSNVSGCLLKYDQQTGACVGQCVNNDQLFGLALAAIVIGVILLVVSMTCTCVAFCCCCGCTGALHIGHRLYKRFTKKQVAVTTNASEDLYSQQEALEYGGSLPLMYPGQSGPTQSYFVPFPHPAGSEIAGHPFAPVAVPPATQSDV